MGRNERVICVNKGGVPTLTLNKVYDAKIYDDNIRMLFVGLFNDKGEYRNFKMERFMLLSEWRSNKLKELGI